MTPLEQQILRLVENVQKDEDQIGVYSTGEYLAVALVLDRKDLLEQTRARQIHDAGSGQ